MSDFLNCANYGLRVQYRLKGIPQIVDVPFTGPNKADDSAALIASLRGSVDFVVTQVFIPETTNA